MNTVETCHRRCHTRFRGASGVETCICRRDGWASARVRDAVRGSAVSRWPRRRKREATERRQAHAGNAHQPSTALHTVGEGRKRLAGAYSIRDKGQAPAATDRARVARLRCWSTRLRSAQARTVTSVWAMYPSTYLPPASNGQAMAVSHRVCSVSAAPPVAVAQHCASLPAFLSTWSRRRTRLLI